MSDMDQYMPPVELDAPMRGLVCGTVVNSHHPDYAEGAIVSGLGRRWCCRFDCRPDREDQGLPRCRARRNQ